MGLRLGYSSIKISKPDWVAEKKIKLLNVLALERSPELPDVPAIMEFATSERQKQIFRFVLNAQTLGRRSQRRPAFGGSRRRPAQGVRRHHGRPGAAGRDEGQEARGRADPLAEHRALLKDLYATPRGRRRDAGDHRGE